MTDEDAINPGEEKAEAVAVARRTLAEVLQELDDRMARVKPKRGREPSLANARSHLSDALNYLGGSHFSVAAISTAFCAAFLDHTEGRPLTEALNDRWGQVRGDLPESLRDGMPDRVWVGSAARSARRTSLTRGCPEATGERLL